MAKLPSPNAITAPTIRVSRRTSLHIGDRDLEIGDVAIGFGHGGGRPTRLPGHHSALRRFCVSTNARSAALIRLR
jgi:hypothetical protein